MAALDDLISTVRGLVTNLSRFVTQATAPGWTLATTASPSATVVTTLGTTSVQVIGSSTTRRGIAFFAPAQTAANLWIVPSNVTAAINQGILLSGAGASFVVPTWLSVNSAWNAISTTNGTGSLTIVEFF